MFCHLFQNVTDCKNVPLFRKRCTRFNVSFFDFFLTMETYNDFIFLRQYVSMCVDFKFRRSAIISIITTLGYIVHYGIGNLRSRVNWKRYNIYVSHRDKIRKKTKVNTFVLCVPEDLFFLRNTQTPKDSFLPFHVKGIRIKCTYPGFNEAYKKVKSFFIKNRLKSKA